MDLATALFAHRFSRLFQDGRPAATNRDLRAMGQKVFTHRPAKAAAPTGHQKALAAQ
jgi:hypothetical protein